MVSNNQSPRTGSSCPCTARYEITNPARKSSVPPFIASLRSRTTVRGESICTHTHGGSSVLFAPRQRRGTTAFMVCFYRSFKPTVSRETRCRRCCNGIPTMPGNYSLRVGAVLSSSHDHTLLMFSREPSGMCVSYYSRSRKRLELGLSRKPGTSLSSLPFWRGFRISFGSV